MTSLATSASAKLTAFDLPKVEYNQPAPKVDRDSICAHHTHISLDVLRTKIARDDEISTDELTHLIAMCRIDLKRFENELKGSDLSDLDYSARTRYIDGQFDDSEKEVKKHKFDKQRVIQQSIAEDESIITLCKKALENPKLHHFTNKPY